MLRKLRRHGLPVASELTFSSSVVCFNLGTSLSSPPEASTIARHLFRDRSQPTKSLHCCIGVTYKTTLSLAPLFAFP